MPEDDVPVTRLLVQWRAGDDEALNALIPLVYAKLREIASRQLARERSGFTLCATEVVHEVYQKLIGTDVSWQDRSHFLAIAARQMRQVLVDYARSKSRQKRGGEDWQRVTLNEIADGGDSAQVDILSIQQALEKLSSLDEQKANIVDLIVFGGLTGKDVAEVMNISEQTVWREWRMARAFLNVELKSIKGQSKAANGNL